MDTVNEAGEVFFGKVSMFFVFTYEEMVTQLAPINGYLLAISRSNGKPQ